MKWIALAIAGALFFVAHLSRGAEVLRSQTISVPLEETQIPVRVDLLRTGDLRVTPDLDRPASVSVSTNLPYFWSIWNGYEDRQFTEDIFMVGQRLFAVSWSRLSKSRRHLPLKAKDRRFLHELHFRLETKPREVFKGLAAMALPLAMGVRTATLFLGMAHDSAFGGGNPAHTLATEDPFLNAGATLFIGTGCAGYLSRLKTVRKTQKTTAVIMDRAPVEIIEVRRNSHGEIDDAVYKTQAGRTGRVSDL